MATKPAKNPVKRKAAARPNLRPKSKPRAPKGKAKRAQKLTPPAPPPLPGTITALLDSCPLGVAISSVAEAKIVYANVPMARFFGITRVAAHGRHVADFYADPADREYVRAMLASKGSIYRYRMRGKAADGTERSARLSAHLISYNGETAILSWIEDETDSTYLPRAAQEPAGK